MININNTDFFNQCYRNLSLQNYNEYFYHSRADNCSQVWSLIHDSSYDVVISQGNHCSMNREAEIQLM